MFFHLCDDIIYQVALLNGLTKVGRSCKKPIDFIFHSIVEKVF